MIAYAKVQAATERRGCAALAGSDAVRVPRILAHDDGVLVLEALVGRRLDRPRAFGATLPRCTASAQPLSRLHAHPRAPASRSFDAPRPVDGSRRAARVDRDARGRTARRRRARGCWSGSARRRRRRP